MTQEYSNRRNTIHPGKNQASAPVFERSTTPPLCLKPKKPQAIGCACPQKTEVEIDPSVHTMFIWKVTHILDNISIGNEVKLFCSTDFDAFLAREHNLVLS